ncbi:hypothetical protein ACDA63_07295 [Uliginosibacterium sp. sgz301328]|uniref:hypothetical protein n=1 Tax=Uliginosibacterium sp. sgz301328 TaxID=3243764 RepID=UPI00359CCFBD
MAWFEVVVQTVTVFAVEADSDDEAQDVAVNEIVGDGTSEVSSSFMAEDDIQIDRFKRHADKVLEM